MKSAEIHLSSLLIDSFIIHVRITNKHKKSRYCENDDNNNFKFQSLFLYNDSMPFSLSVISTWYLVKT